ncbi:MAG: ankyrin repeat domain-containing protein [Candidatus Cardinium sp.]|nr:MAG: ankyrin repeat domain-containing protein [Candidatus Cardinium sp.]
MKKYLVLLPLFASCGLSKSNMGPEGQDMGPEGQDSQIVGGSSLDTSSNLNSLLGDRSSQEVASEILNLPKDELSLFSIAKRFTELKAHFSKKPNCPFQDFINSLVYCYKKEISDKIVVFVVQCGYTELLKALFSYGDKIDVNGEYMPYIPNIPNMPSTNRATPWFTLIHIAAGYKKPETAIPVIEILLANGADINKKDSDGRTALHVTGWVKTAEFLLNKDADINAKDNNGCTVLRSEIVSLCELLENYKEDCDFSMTLEKLSKIEGKSLKELDIIEGKSLNSEYVSYIN